MTRRATSPQDVFDAMPSRFLPEAAGNTRATIQFDLSGEGGGQWHVTIADRTLSVAQGAAADPTMTLAAAASDYVDMINGVLDPVGAFMRGKVQVKGDVSLALKLPKLFGAGRSG